VDVGHGLIVVVVFWSVWLFFWVDERVYFGAESEGVEVVDVEDVELQHDGGGVCSGREVDEEPDDFLMDCVEWLEVGFAFVG
jgi:hypothetical protein